MLSALTNLECLEIEDSVNLGSVYGLEQLVNLRVLRIYRVPSSIFMCVTQIIDGWWWLGIISLSVFI